MASDLPLRFFDAFVALRPILQEALADAGVLSGADYHYLFEGSEEEAGEIAVDLGGGAADAPQLVQLWLQTRSHATSRVAFMSRFSVAESETFAMGNALTRERRRLRLDVTPSSSNSQLSPFAKVAVPTTVKWPSNLRRQLAAAGGAEARADAEAKERARWVTELQSLIRHAHLPIVSVAETTNLPGSAWAGIAQGLRARTIRRRVKDWAKASRYFATTTGHPWPQSLGIFLDYLQVLCDGGPSVNSQWCGHGVPVYGASRRG